MGPKVYNGILLLKKVGTSLGFIIPKNIRQDVNIVENEYIGVKLWKIVPKEVTCISCEGKFMGYIKSENHICPFCGKEFNEVKGGNKIKMSEEEEKKEDTEEEDTEDEAEDESDEE